MKRLALALALAASCLAAHASVIEAKWKGTVVSSSDTPNILGYGGGDSAIGSRITIKFRWNTADAPSDGGGSPTEADYSNYGMPAWLKVMVEFDNGFEMASSEFASTDAQQIKIQNNYYSPCATGVSGCDSYGNAAQLFTDYGQQIDTFYAFARITDYTLALVNSLERDQLLNWSAGASGTYFADGQFSYRHSDSQYSANNFDVWAYAHLDSLNVRAIPEPGALALLGIGLAGLAASQRRVGRRDPRVPTEPAPGR